MKLNMKLNRDLDAIPAVDAAPVVHGRWKAILNPFWDAECSECGYAKKNGWEWRFCPNCGAKMDEEG
jgi:rubrerythrin